MKIPYKYAVALTAALALFMAVLDSTIVNVALVSMERDFKTTINSVQWIITGYLLAQAAVIPVTGYFGNRFGVKRIFMLALTLFTIFSLLCGLSPHLATGESGLRLLIIFRVLQGIGGGMLFPLGSAIAFSAFPPEERAGSSAVVAIPILFAPALGPTVGGLIVDSGIKWPGIFFINVPVGIITLALIARIVRADEKAEIPAGARAPRFDYLGLLLSIVGVVLVVYAFVLVSQTKGGSITPQRPAGVINGWGYWPVWALLGAGVVILTIFSLLELRVIKDPVLDLRLFATRDFAVASFATWMARALVFGSFLLVPLFLQQFRGDSAVRTGLILMSQGIGSMIGITTGSRLYDRVGPRILTTVGMAVLVGATVWLIKIGPDSDARFFVPVLFFRGIAFGWGNLPLQTVALASITGRGLPKASSLYNASAQIFTSIGTAVVATLLVQRTTVHASSLVAGALASGGRPPANLTLLAGSSAMSDVFKYLTVGSVVVCLTCLLMPRQSLKQKMAGAAPQPAPGGAMQPAFATAATPSPGNKSAPVSATPMPQRAIPEPRQGASGGPPPGAAYAQERPAWQPNAAPAPMTPEPAMPATPAPLATPVTMAQAPPMVTESDSGAEAELVAALERFVRGEAGAARQTYERRIAALEDAVARMVVEHVQHAEQPAAMDEERIATIERSVGNLDRFARSMPPPRWHQMHDIRTGALEQRIAAIERSLQQLAWGNPTPSPRDGADGVAPNGGTGYYDRGA